MYSDDIQFPSTVCRKYAHGLGSLYPTGYVSQSLYPYESEMPPGEYYNPAQPRTFRMTLPAATMERRAVNRMMALLQVSYAPQHLDAEQLATMHRAMAFYREVRPSLFGDRYVLTSPLPLRAPEHREPGEWEVYEYLSPSEQRISIFVFRGLSPEVCRTVRMKGLERTGQYVARSYSGRIGGACSGAKLMDEGIECCLDETAGADAVIFDRVGES